MIDRAVNQTLSRTILTSGTTLLVVLLLYVVGGPGIHAFAFTMLVGVIFGHLQHDFHHVPAGLWLPTPLRDGGRGRAGIGQTA